MNAINLIEVIGYEAKRMVELAKNPQCCERFRYKNNWWNLSKDRHSNFIMITRDFGHLVIETSVCNNTFVGVEKIMWMEAPF